MGDGKDTKETLYAWTVVPWYLSERWDGFRVLRTCPGPLECMHGVERQAIVDDNQRLECWCYRFLYNAHDKVNNDCCDDYRDDGAWPLNLSAKQQWRIACLWWYSWKERQENRRNIRRTARGSTHTANRSHRSKRKFWEVKTRQSVYRYSIAVLRHSTPNTGALRTKSVVSPCTNAVYMHTDTRIYSSIHTRAHVCL